MTLRAQACQSLISNIGYDIELIIGYIDGVYVFLITLRMLDFTNFNFQREYVSALFRHIVWFWMIEMIRRDLSIRQTYELDAEISMDSPFRLFQVW